MRNYLLLYVIKTNSYRELQTERISRWVGEFTFNFLLVFIGARRSIQTHVSVNALWIIKQTLLLHSEMKWLSSIISNFLLSLEVHLLVTTFGFVHLLFMFRRIATPQWTQQSIYFHLLFLFLLIRKESWIVLPFLGWSKFHPGISGDNLDPQIYTLNTQLTL